MKAILSYFKHVFSSKKEQVKISKLSGLDRADALLQKLIDDRKIPGLAIAVANKSKTYFEKGYGYADLEKQQPVKPKETIFRIASVSKPIAATALAHMVAEKQIDLDASLYTYVPYFPKKEWDFSIRQLASHTAGIRSYKGTEYGLNKSYSIKEGITVFKDDDLLFKPGTDYHYNSFDWILISLAIQEVSGIPFEDYVQEKVLHPLGMKNTKPEITATTAYANFYSRNRLGFREAIPVNNLYKLAGGGYVSTTEDIIKLGQAYLNKEILSNEIINQFITSEVIANKLTYYGLGWQVSTDKKGNSYYGHIGNGVGGYSNFYIYPKEQLVISILVNCTNPNIQEELDEVVAIFVSEAQKNSIMA